MIDNPSAAQASSGVTSTPATAQASDGIQTSALPASSERTPATTRGSTATEGAPSQPQVTTTQGNQIVITKKAVEWNPMPVPSLEPFQADPFRLRRVVLDFCDDWRVGLDAADPTIVGSSAQLWLLTRKAIRSGTDGKLKSYMESILPRHGEDGDFGKEDILDMLESVTRLHSPPIAYEEMETKWKCVTQGSRGFDEFYAEFEQALVELAAIGEQESPAKRVSDKQILDQMQVAVNSHLRDFIDQERRFNATQTNDRGGWIDLAQKISESENRNKVLMHRQQVVMNSVSAAAKPQKGKTPQKRKNGAAYRPLVEPLVTAISPGGPLQSQPVPSAKPPQEELSRKQQRKKSASARCWSCQQPGHLSTACPFKSLIAEFIGKMVPGVGTMDEKSDDE